jgi:hypothetical protein
MPERMDDRTEKMAREAIEEARMVLPGIQALFGFQLIAVFSDRFKWLTDFEQIAHFVAVILVALSIALIMTPAAYHRQVERSSVSEFFLHLTSWLITVAMVPLMAALCIEIYLLGILVLNDQRRSATIAGLLLLVFAGLWFVFPRLAHRGPRQRRMTGDKPGSRHADAA